MLNLPEVSTYLDLKSTVLALSPADPNGSISFQSPTAQPSTSEFLNPRQEAEKSQAATEALPTWKPNTE